VQTWLLQHLVEVREMIVLLKVGWVDSEDHKLEAVLCEEPLMAQRSASTLKVRCPCQAFDDTCE
jgi:hypothetical protein